MAEETEVSIVMTTFACGSNESAYTRFIVKKGFLVRSNAHTADSTTRYL